MTSQSHPSPKPAAVGRRAILRGGIYAGVLATAVLPVATACTGRTSQSAGVDPLRALAQSATADAAAAKAIAGQFPDIAAKANLVATNRTQQATVLWQEVNRASTTTVTPSPTSSSASVGTFPDVHSATAALVAAVAAAQRQASDIVASVPSYRAGLVGSIAAGCACLKEVLS